MIPDQTLVKFIGDDYHPFGLDVRVQKYPQTFPVICRFFNYLKSQWYDAIFNVVE